MDEAVWQFCLFERASLHYLSTEPLETDPTVPVGLWDKTVTEAELNAPRLAPNDTRLAKLIDEGFSSPAQSWRALVLIRLRLW